MKTYFTMQIAPKRIVVFAEVMASSGEFRDVKANEVDCNTVGSCEWSSNECKLTVAKHFDIASSPAAWMATLPELAQRLVSPLAPPKLPRASLSSLNPLITTLKVIWGGSIPEHDAQKTKWVSNFHDQNERS